MNAETTDPEFNSRAAMEIEKMAEIDKLKVGSFYWVLIALDPDTDEAWENQVMPARFAGIDEVSRQPLWNFLNQEGASDWAVRWIGDEIVAPER